MAKTKPSNGSTESAPNFEQSLAELQQIVSQLEDGSIGLEESMQRFEEGMSLLRRCYGVLEQAEQKIEILTGFDADGNPITADFDATATHTPAQTTAGRRSRRRAEEKETEAAPDEPEPDPPRLF